MDVAPVILFWKTILCHIPESQPVVVKTTASRAADL